ncbi:MAG TPA: hypothetical protein VFQ47_10140 [Nitrososphaera sp.]|jgi:hypothetical protein|nr:hypothetical protein [Nitrososphaera sp.]
MRDQIRGRLLLHLTAEYDNINNSTVGALQPRQKDIDFLLDNKERVTKAQHQQNIDAD